MFKVELMSSLNILNWKVYIYWFHLFLQLSLHFIIIIFFLFFELISLSLWMSLWWFFKFPSMVIFVCVCMSCVEGLWSLEPNRLFDRFGGGGGQWRRHFGRSFSTVAVFDDSIDGGGGSGNCGHLYRPPVHGVHSVFTTPVSFFSWQ